LTGSEVAVRLVESMVSGCGEGGVISCAAQYDGQQSLRIEWWCWRFGCGGVV